METRRKKKNQHTRHSTYPDPAPHAPKPNLKSQNLTTGAIRSAAHQTVPPDQDLEPQDDKAEKRQSASEQDQRTPRAKRPHVQPTTPTPMPNTLPGLNCR